MQNPTLNGVIREAVIGLSASLVVPLQENVVDGIITKTMKELEAQFFFGLQDFSEISERTLEDVLQTISTLRLRDPLKIKLTPFVKKETPHLLQTGLTGPKKKFFSISGIDPSTNFCCVREHALKKLAKLFADRTVWRGGSILVQAAPTSGKTGFMSLFQATMMEYNTISITLHGADDLLSFMAGLNPIFNKQQLSELGCQKVNRISDIWQIIDDPTIWKDPSKPLILLIDEGQHLFSGSGTSFLQMIKERQAPNKIYTSIVFSMYNMNTVKVALQRGDPGSSGDWVKRYYFSDLLQWSWEDCVEYFEDFHKNNQSGTTVIVDVQRLIFDKCDGHGGYISTILYGISCYCHSNLITVFGHKEWFEYLRTNFTSDMNKIRSSVTIADLLHLEELSGAVKICEQLVLQSSMKLDHLQPDVKWLMKLGIIQSLGKSTFVFTSSVMRVVFLRCLITQDLPSVPTKVIYKDPLAFLMACLPLIKQKSVQRCLSLTSRDGHQTQKEDVWVCQIFAAAQSILPVGCVVEPQFTSKAQDERKQKKRAKKSNDTKVDQKKSKDHGEVDIIVHNGTTYMLEFLITEASTATAKKYIEEHLARFTKDGQYQHHLHFPAAVVNITHIPQPIEVDIPQGCTAQLFHFCVTPEYTEANLMWKENDVDHKVPIVFGSSMFYNKLKQQYGFLDTTKL